MKIKHKYLIFLFLVAFVFFPRCTKDETDSTTGTLVLKITDAASDDEDIKGIFITVSDIKINGKPIRNHVPQMIEISSLINGETYLLVNKELAAKEYDEISLVLSASSPNSVNAPGCYVLTKNNTKHNLIADGTAEIEIMVAKAFEVIPAAETKLVADFDLRKAIIRNESGKSSYQFVSPEELENVVRVIHEKKTGKIYGTVNANLTYDSEIYVLIYKKGEFKASAEGSGNGKSKVLFANAITSTKVESDESYNLSFLEEGEYDIRLASFRKTNANQFSFYGFLPTTSRKTGMLLNNIAVSPGSSIEINIEVFRLL